MIAAGTWLSLSSVADYYLVERAKGPAWDHSRPRREDPWPEEPLRTESIRRRSVWLRAPAAG